MQFSYAFHGSSAVQSTGGRTHISFAPDTTRNPTFFAGTLCKKIAFREAISALHNVVVSDLRFKPKDRTAYKAWLAERGDVVDWREVGSMRKSVEDQMKALQNELAELDRRAASRWGAFNKAKRAYFDYLYTRDKDTWFVLDPVITVHPDEVFFECFSQDESSYGRLSASFEVFKDIKEQAFGTTNIDYSEALYNEFQKIRSYKETQFVVDPSGFTVQTTNEEDFKEVKIDLPDSWVRGFLQVSSAMCLDTIHFDLHPLDLHNLCFVLRRHKEKEGPRSMRYILTPNQPVKVRFDPWGTEVVCPRSIYTGKEATEVRVWGRRRIHILERLIPLARKFTVHLLGRGMPSFYVADLGDMSFTLGLSGWTANDWSHAGAFDLMSPRASVDLGTSERVFAALRKDWRATPDALSESLGLDRGVVLGALAGWTQAGRAMFDLNKGVYRARELSREPLPIEKLRFSSEREQQAAGLVAARAVVISVPRVDATGRLHMGGSVRDRGSLFSPAIQVDADERLVEGSCSCNFFKENRLRKGPCAHMLAIRLQSAPDSGRLNPNRIGG
jgi:hypothetical protein